MQRLLWASTGTKDPQAKDTFYIEALAAPDTVNTVPEKTLLAFDDHGHVGEVMAEGRRRRGAGVGAVRAAQASTRTHLRRSCSTPARNRS